VRLLQGDVLDRLREMPDESVICIVTSPPYWGLRDYGCDGQIGLEKTPQEYIAKMVGVFAECRRILRSDGTCWINIGDSYSPDGKQGGLGGGKNYTSAAGGYNRQKESIGLPNKNVMGMPWRLAFALQDDGWYLRQDIIWHKPNPMPESVRDRCTKAHEYIFLLTKSARYFWNQAAIAEPCNYPDGPGNITGDERHRTKAGLLAIGARETRNKRSVWTINTGGYPGAHFATFPEELPQTCILAGCPESGTVLDPFLGSGTTVAVALALGRNAIGIELNPEYVKLAEKRLSTVTPGFQFGEVA
jgi:DNA modification methylase